MLSPTPLLCIQPGTLYAKDLEQTLDEISRSTACPRSVGSCAMIGVGRLASGRVHVSLWKRCIRQPSQREKNESESQMGAQLSGYGQFRVLSRKGLETLYPSHFTPEETEV